ncbi:MAG: hypothetical protein EOP45_07225 [Sphingobacteriaceae bacterium]|nr:MAG: hypothetical protein EOP45_07225 [Sphingobacteriaceae bacterium]
MKFNVLYFLSITLFTFSDNAIALDCAEANPWNLDDVTSFSERFHPSEFDEDVRNQVRLFLLEFAEVALNLKLNCYNECIESKCRKTVLRGGVILRHVVRHCGVYTGRPSVYSGPFMHDVLEQIDTFRNHIASEFIPSEEAENMINVLHNTHYELQRPQDRDRLVLLAQNWHRIPRLFISG